MDSGQLARAAVFALVSTIVGGGTTTLSGAFLAEGSYVPALLVGFLGTMIIAYVLFYLVREVVREELGRIQQQEPSTSPGEIGQVETTD